MKHFYIISNSDKPANKVLSEKIKDYLLDKGCTAVLSDTSFQTIRKHDSYLFTNPDNVPENTEAVLCLGGDGTLLHAGKDLHHKHIPLLGINSGTLGYLTEVDPDSVIEACDNLIKDNFAIEEHMMLAGRLNKPEHENIWDHALNDIVLCRSVGNKTNDYNIYVDGAFLKRYVADGIILSTPTGSTAYNLAAGGPIIDPLASSILMTPIAPHSLNNRSIILRSEAEIVVEITKREDKPFTPVQISFDGSDGDMLEAGESIIIRKSEITVPIIKLSNVSFLEVLRRKMADNI